MLNNIHSELELGQVQRPEQMTIHHKLMFEQLYQPGKIGYLPEALSRELEQERARLQEQGNELPRSKLRGIRLGFIIPASALRRRSVASYGECNP